MSPDSYASLTAALGAIGLTGQQVGPHQLVVSAQEGAVWPDRGNSFWLSLQNGACYLGTWSPACYRIPSGQDVIALCSACMEVSESAMYRVPDDIVARFGLERISDDEFERLFPENDHASPARATRATKMWVVTVDEKGREKDDGHWVDIPEPDSFASDGFAHIESYVSRLLQSSARYTSLIIGTPDEQIAVGIGQRGGIRDFSISVDWRSEPDREKAIRKFFGERRLTIYRDYLAGNGDVPDATRCLDYYLPSDVHFITALTKDVLREIYQLREDDALDFIYEEDSDAV